MIEWNEEKPGHWHGYCGELEIFYYSKGGSLYWMIKGHQPIGAIAIREQAFTKAETLFQQLLNKAKLVPLDEIFSCPECGDSGMSRKSKEGCDSSCPHETICDGICVVDPDPCPCRQKPYSIYSIKHKER